MIHQFIQSLFLCFRPSVTPQTVIPIVEQRKRDYDLFECILARKRWELTYGETPYKI